MSKMPIKLKLRFSPRGNVTLADLGYSIYTIFGLPAGGVHTVQRADAQFYVLVYSWLRDVLK